MSGVPGCGWWASATAFRFESFRLCRSSVIFMAYVRPLRVGLWRGGRGNWRNEANLWGKWLSSLGGSQFGAGSASCAGNRGTLRVTRCFAKLPQKRIPRVSDGPFGGVGWGVVTQNSEGRSSLRVRISHFIAMGCGHGRKFCVANLWITRALPGRRRDVGLLRDRGGAGGFDLTLSGHGSLRWQAERTCPTLRIEEQFREFVGE